MVLGRHLGYVSDETITVEHDLTVRPYAKPLSIAIDAPAPHPGHACSPDDLGLLHAPERLRLAAVALLEQRDDAATPALTSIGLVEAMAAVLPQTSALPRLDRPLDRLARVCATGHGPYRLTYRDIDDCLDLVTDLAHARERHPAVDVTWSWIDGGDLGTAHAGPEPRPDLVELDQGSLSTPVPDDLGPSTHGVPHLASTMPWPPTDPSSCCVAGPRRALEGARGDPVARGRRTRHRRGPDDRRGAPVRRLTPGGTPRRRDGSGASGDWSLGAGAGHRRRTAGTRAAYRCTAAVRSTPTWFASDATQASTSANSCSRWAWSPLRTAWASSPTSSASHATVLGTPRSRSRSP